MTKRLPKYPTVNITPSFIDSVPGLTPAATVLVNFLNTKYPQPSDRVWQVSVFANRADISSVATGARVKAFRFSKSVPPLGPIGPTFNYKARLIPVKVAS